MLLKKKGHYGHDLDLLTISYHVLNILGEMGHVAELSKIIKQCATKGIVCFIHWAKEIEISWR